MDRVVDVRVEAGGNVKVEADAVVHLTGGVFVEKRVIWSLLDIFEDVGKDIRYAAVVD